MFEKVKKIFQSEKEKNVYEEGLAKTRQNFVSSLNKLAKKHPKIDDQYFEELENILISADIGVETVLKFMEKLSQRVKQERIINSEDLKEIIVDELFVLYVEGESLTDKINYQESLTVLLFIGVNGSGKTTTIAKMAQRLKSEGKRVMLIAGDTFRAGAVEQLCEWGRRLEIEVMHGLNQDPASVIYEGLEKAKENYDVVLIDTAGRLQKKTNLMAELDKINRVISKLVPNAPHETLLVIDATTGQNGISQAKSFNEVTNVTGIILTKLDGTAKGGIVIAIKDVTKIPVKFIGLGEKLDDLQIFDIEKYIYGLFREW